jgi:hypothetical protein
MASAQVMHIPELTHNIMKYLDYQSLKGLRQVSKSYRDLIDGSTELQIVLFNKPWTSGPLGFDRWVKHNNIESHDAEDEYQADERYDNRRLKLGACTKNNCKFVIPTNPQTDDQLAKIQLIVEDPKAFFHPLIQKFIPGFSRLYYRGIYCGPVNNVTTFAGYKLNEWTKAEFLKLANESLPKAKLPIPWITMYATQPPVKQITFMWHLGFIFLPTGERVCYAGPFYTSWLENPTGIKLYDFFETLRMDASKFNKKWVHARKNAPADMVMKSKPFVGLQIALNAIP